MNSDTLKKPKRAMLYARVSSEEQADNYSIDTQLTACALYCEKHSFEIVGSVWDEISGAEIDRPGMTEILDKARQRQIDVVVCFDIDRFARDFVPLYIHERELDDCGVRVEYTSHTFDDGPSGQMQKDMLVAFAKFERLKIKERSIRGRIGKAREGKVPMLGGGRPRYGYFYEDGYYVINEEQASIVRLIFEWYVIEKIGAVVIAERLTEMRVPTGIDAANTGRKRNKTGYGHWSPTTVYAVLTDERYAGHYFYNKTIARGKRVQRRPREEWIHVPVPAIVDEAMFQAAQTQRQKNISHSKRNTQNVYLLQRRMRCACCGYVFNIRSMKSTTGRLYYYGCSGQERRLFDDLVPRCHGYVRVEKVDAVVWAALKKYLSDSDRIREGLEASRADDTLATRIEHISQEIAVLKEQRKKLLDLYLSDSLPRDLLDARAKQIQERLAAFETTLEQLQSQRRLPLSLTDIDDIVTAIATIRHQMDCATDAQKQFVIDKLDIQATLDRPTQTITLEGLLPTLRIDYSTDCCLRTKTYMFSLATSYA